MQNFQKVIPLILAGAGACASNQMDQAVSRVDVTTAVEQRFDAECNYGQDPEREFIIKNYPHQIIRGMVGQALHELVGKDFGPSREYIRFKMDEGDCNNAVYQKMEDGKDSPQQIAYCSNPHFKFNPSTNTPFINQCDEIVITEAFTVRKADFTDIKGQEISRTLSEISNISTIDDPKDCEMNKAILRIYQPQSSLSSPLPSLTRYWSCPNNETRTITYDCYGDVTFQIVNGKPSFSRCTTPFTRLETIYRNY
jgi:hypothetical protein